MQHPDPRGTGARDSSDADASLAGDASVSSKFRVSVQARLPAVDHSGWSSPPRPWRRLGPVVNAVVDDLYRFVVGSS